MKFSTHEIHYASTAFWENWFETKEILLTLTHGCSFNLYVQSTVFLPEGTFINLKNKINNYKTYMNIFL